ncbi:MAG: DUF1214 domain-containing protein [Rhizobiaceae bacterium]
MVFRLFQITIALAVAFAVGIYGTWYSIRGADRFGAVRIGGWIAYPDSGTTTADPYAKARLARDAPLFLGAAEGITFYAETDDTGQSLSGSCNYMIVGTSPTARLWTMYAVGQNQTPLKLGDNSWPTALHSNEILYQSSGGFRIAVAPTARPDNWLAVQSGQNFSLAFSLYDSTVATTKGLVETSFPTVTKVKCDA